MTNLLPNAGSEEALARGCLCPVFDNGHGKGSGYVDEEGNPTFWVNEFCPLHARKDKPIAS